MKQKPEGALVSAEDLKEDFTNFPKGHYWVGASSRDPDQVVFGFYFRYEQDAQPFIFTNCSRVWRTLHSHTIQCGKIEDEGYSFTNYFHAWAYYLKMKERFTKNEAANAEAP